MLLNDVKVSHNKKEALCWQKMDIFQTNDSAAAQSHNLTKNKSACKAYGKRQKAKGTFFVQ